MGWVIERRSSLLLFLYFFFLCTAFSYAAVVPLGLQASPEYVDLVKNAPRWAAVGSAPSLPLDPTGWPQNDFEWVFDFRRNKPWDGPDFSGVNDNINGTYLLSFSGKATLSGSGSEVPNAIQITDQVYDATTQTTTANVIIIPGHWLLILSFTNTQRAGQATNNTGLTNIKMYRPGYPLSNTQLFTNEFTQLVTSLNSATLRSFDTGINSYGIWYGTDLINNTWADRSLPTDAYWPLPSRNVGNVSGLAMPWEIYMQICLQTNTPGWFNLPVGADDEYVYNFAMLLKNGNSYTKPLNPDLPFYIFTVWNWGFSQAIYNEVKAKANNISNIQNYVQRVFQVSAIFRQVFGAAAMGTTVRVVCMWQYSTWDAMQQALLWAQQKFGNPVDYYIWGIGEAPYVNPLEGGHVPYSLLDPTGVDRIIDSLYSGAGQRRQAFTAWQSVATFFGIHVVGYESGPSLSAGIEGEASRSPRLKDFVYRYYMENYFPTGAETVNFFALGPGGPSPYGDWYLFEHWGEYNYGKLQGYQSISLLAYPSLIVGYVLPWTAGESVHIDASQFDWTQKPNSRVTICAQGCWPDPAVISYLLRATATGDYQITLYGSSQTGASVILWIDNTQIKMFNLPQQTGNITIPFQLNSVGLHTLALSGSGTGSTSLTTGWGFTITLVNGKGTPTPPSAPLNVLATPENQMVSLIWEPVSTATSYTIQRSTQSGGPYQTVGSSPNSSYVDTGLQNNVRYYYVVTASNSAGASALSIQVQVVPVQSVLPAAPAVTVSCGLQYGQSPAGGLGQVYLVWNAVPNAQTYSISLSLITESTHASSTLSTQYSTVYYDIGLTPGAMYSYNISATNSVGTGPITTVSVTIPTTSTPGAPSSLNVTAMGGVAFLQWNQPIWSYPELGELFIVERATATTGPFTQLEALSTNNFADYNAGTTPYCYRVWASSSKGGNSAQPSNVACI